MLGKLIAEFIGTFFLVTAIGMAVINDSAGSLAPLAIGITLVVMVYSCGHISGAHFNPAVTIGLWLRGACSRKEVLPYIAVEVAGALAASAFVMILKGDYSSWLEARDASLVAWKAIFAEFAFTFALVWVILNVATAPSNDGNSFYGIAIGGTVAAGAFVVGPVSSAVFNPAVAVAVATLGLIEWSQIWIYLVANFAGGIVAAVVFLAAMKRPGELPPSEGESRQ